MVAVRLYLGSALVALACSPVRGPSGANGAGRYAATIDRRGGGCCSESCGAHSTVADVVLELDARGGARAAWTRRGCTVTETGDGPLSMPFDPGGPEALCVAQSSETGARRQMLPLDAKRTWTGSWSERDGALAIELHEEGARTARSWRLSCADGDAEERGRVPLPEGVIACRSIDARWDEVAGLEAQGLLYLADRPGLRVSERERGLGGDGELSFEYVERGSEAR